MVSWSPMGPYWVFELRCHPDRHRGAQKRPARTCWRDRLEIHEISRRNNPRRAAVSEHREPFAGGAGDAAGPNSSATHPASVRTATAGIKQMLYGIFYSKRPIRIDLPKC